MKKLTPILVFIFCLFLASFYIYPIFSGLMLLPLDLLVSNSGPWAYASTILLKNSFMQDAVLQIYPWHHLVFQSLTHGVVPLWNPYQFMGMPFMAGMRQMVFYPANIFFVFGEVASWNILLWLQLFLSLWFFYLFIREYNVHPLASIFGAIAYAFNSYMIGVLQFGSEGHVLLWLPCILFFIKRYIDRAQIRYLVGIAFSLATAIFASQIQYFGIECLVILAFIVYMYIQTPRSFTLYIHIGIAMLAGVGIAAIQIIPTIELLNLSSRGFSGNYNLFVGGLLKPYHLLRLFSPDWFGNPVTHDLRGGYIESAGYIGIIPLFFTIYSFVMYRKNTFVRFFGLILFGATLLSLWGVGQVLFFFHIPLIISGSGGRIFTMALFAAAILAGFGLQAFFAKTESRHKQKILMIYLIMLAGMYSLGLIGYHFGLVFGAAFSNIRFQIAIAVGFSICMLGYFLFAKNQLIKILFIICIVGLSYFDVFRMGYRFLTFSNPKFLYPDIPVLAFVRSESKSTLDRVYGLTDLEIYSALKVSSMQVYNSLYLKRTGLLMHTLEDKSDVALPMNKYILSQNKRMKYAADFLGVSLMATLKDVDPAISYFHEESFQNDIVRIYRDDRNDVYRNTAAYPRFGLYYKAIQGVSDKDSLRMIRDKSVDFKTTVLLKDTLPISLQEGTGSSNLVTNTINSQRYHVSTSTPALFYLSDTIFPGWRAMVNGRKTKIYEANYNFRAVFVPAGESDLVFDYLPASFIWGAAVSGVTSVLFTLFCFWQWIISTAHKKTIDDKK